MTLPQRRIWVAAFALASTASAGFVGFAQGRGAPPRTREGRPDLQGIWSYATLTPLERPSEFAGKAFLTDAEAAAFERETLTVQNRDRRDGEGPTGRGSDGRTDLDRAYNQVWWEYGAKVVGTRRTSLLIDPPDGQIPPLTAEGRARVRRQARAVDRKRRVRGRRARPELRFLPGSPAAGAVPGMDRDRAADDSRRVQQQHGDFSDAGRDGDRQRDGARAPHRAVRRPIACRLVDPAVDGRCLAGDGTAIRSIVDTTNFRPAVFRGASASLHLVERFRRVDAETLLYEFTVDDPVTWIRPWTVQFPMTRSREPIFEYACHEGNYSLPNILAGAARGERTGSRAALSGPPPRG